MRAIAIIPLVLFLIVTTVVGVRLLALARRTRELPEAAIGGGLGLVGLVGMPLAALGRIPGNLGTPVGDGCFVAGIVVIHVGIGLIFLFTWSVFRRDSRVGSAGLLLVWICLAVAAIGLAWNGTGDPDIQKILPRTRPYALGTVGLVGLAFSWSGIESARFYGLLRRRLRLGLADPVVTNRFGLWAVAGGASALMCGVLIGCLAAGMAVLADVLPLMTCAAMGACSSAAFYLSFLPPKRYLDAIRSRAAA